MQVLQRGHDVTVRLGVFLGRMRRWEGARRFEDVTLGAELLDGVAARVTFWGVCDLVIQ